jgi:hypothetical protein
MLLAGAAPASAPSTSTSTGTQVMSAVSAVEKTEGDKTGVSITLAVK